MLMPCHDALLVSVLLERNETPLEVLVYSFISQTVGLSVREYFPAERVSSGAGEREEHKSVKRQPIKTSQLCLSLSSP